MRNTAETIGDVEERLLALGWSRRRIASRLSQLAEISPTTWRRWRNGEHEPNVATWRRIVSELATIEGEANGKVVRRRGRRD
jgi:hypothetical protein